MSKLLFKLVLKSNKLYGLLKVYFMKYFSEEIRKLAEDREVTYTERVDNSLIENSVIVILSPSSITNSTFTRSDDEPSVIAI